MNGKHIGWVFYMPMEQIAESVWKAETWQNLVWAGKYWARNVISLLIRHDWLMSLFAKNRAFLLISIFTNNNFTLLNCISVLPVGLSPFFLANFSYRYDSPYMAFSLLVCVIPFLFKEENKHFIISSVISLFFMCISYQASSGIYIVTSYLFWG